ncbi:hypothetical protein DL768_004267 [Monosporascus sp. mg162]|nr:hypothetical protein DL768_004267 [Monosporascus sp. mg162]
MVDFVAEAWTYLAIALVVICLRLYFKVYTAKGLGRDDCLMVVAGLFYTAETTTAYVIAVLFKDFANNNISPEARAQLSPDSDEWRSRVNGSKGHIIGWFTYTGFSKLQVSFIMALNTITDIYLMAIPLPVILKSRMNTKRKFFLIVLFSGGLLTMVFGILRCITLVTVGATEPSESGQWSVRETFVAVLVSNGPQVVPLFRVWCKKAKGLTTESAHPGSYQLEESKKRSNKNTPSGSNQSSQQRKKKFLHPLSIPNDTAWESHEAIITIQDDSQITSTAPKVHASLSTLIKSQEKDPNDGSVPFEGVAKAVGKPRTSGSGFAKSHPIEDQSDQILVQREWDVSEDAMKAGNHKVDKWGCNANYGSWASISKGRTTGGE